MRCAWEARHSGRPGAQMHRKIHGGRAMPEAVLYSAGKPDDAGGPMRGPTYTCKAVSTGGLVVIYGKPDRAGGPVRKYTARYTEAGLCRRPCTRGLGSPSMREAHSQDLRRRGRRHQPEALLFHMGSPAVREASSKNLQLRHDQKHRTGYESRLGGRWRSCQRAQSRSYVFAPK